MEQFAITQAGTRNNQLSHLVGETFHQVGLRFARSLAQMQFDQKTVSTSTTLPQHLESFEKLWGGLDRQWRASFSTAEKSAYALLETENERDAFRIIHSYARLAQTQGAPDFPIGVENLAQRLGITRPGATWIRNKFVRLGILQKTSDYVPNKAANRFKWLHHAS